MTSWQRTIQDKVAQIRHISTGHKRQLGQAAPDAIETYRTSRKAAPDTIER